MNKAGRSLTRMAFSGLSRGSKRTCASSTGTPTSAVTRKVMRHPIKSLSQVPTGTPTTVASVTPAMMMELALATPTPSGARRPLRAMAVAQKPPILTPSSTRPTNSRLKSPA
ncbi:hypothetical protein D3C84_1115100 [compost metagenome]